MAVTAALTQEQFDALLELLDKLSTIFWGPNLEQCRAMRSPDYFRPIVSLAPVLGPESLAVFEKVKSLIRSYPDTLSLFNSLEEDYVPLFINALDGITSPLYQSCYPDINEPHVEPTLMGASAIRMQQRFNSHGIDLDPDLNEPPDHLAVEIEYLYFLIEKGWTEDNAVLKSEASKFASAEMLAWVPVFEKRLRAAPTRPFYSLIAVILVAVLRLAAAL